MSEMYSLQAQFMDLYNVGNYETALELVTRAHVPDYEAALIAFRVAMLSRLQRTAEAVTLLQEALDKGYWYHEGALKNDPDFAALQSLPEFIAIVEQNRARHQQAEAKPRLTVLNPPPAQTLPPLLLVLHGNFSSVKTFAPSAWEAAAQAGWLVALPQSSQLSWLSDFYDWPDVKAATPEILAHLQTLNGQYDPERVVMLGFSMGGMVTQALVLSGTVKVKGFCLIEGWSLADEMLVCNAEPGLRGHVMGGTAFYEELSQLGEILNARQIPCEVIKTTNPYHGLDADFGETLQRILAGY